MDHPSHPALYMVSKNWSSCFIASTLLTDLSLQYLLYLQKRIQYLPPRINVKLMWMDKSQNTIQYEETSLKIHVSCKHHFTDKQAKYLQECRPSAGMHLSRAVLVPLPIILSLLVARQLSCKFQTIAIFQAMNNIGCLHGVLLPLGGTWSPQWWGPCGVCSQHLSVLLVAQNAGCFPGSVLKRENSHAQLRTSHKPARTSTFCSSSQKQKATLARESKDVPDRSWHGNSDPQVCLPSQHTKKLPDRDAGCLTSSHLRLHKTLTFSNRPGGPGIQTQ